MSALEQSFVYVMAIGDGPHKIGIARNVEARRRELQTAAPTQIEVVYAQSMDRAQAYDVEQSAHRMLRDSRMNGEWFDVTARQAVSAVALATISAAKQEGRDGLDQLSKLGWVVGERMEAALAYRELHTVALRESTAVDGARLGGSLPKIVDARMKRDRVNGEIRKEHGGRALAILVGVAGNGVLIDRFAGDHEAWEAAAELFSKALDVVVEQLNATIGA